MLCGGCLSPKGASVLFMGVDADVIMVRRSPSLLHLLTSQGRRRRVKCFPDSFPPSCILVSKNRSETKRGMTFKHALKSELNAPSLFLWGLSRRVLVTLILQRRPSADSAEQEVNSLGKFCCECSVKSAAAVALPSHGRAALMLLLNVRRLSASANSSIGPHYKD